MNNANKISKYILTELKAGRIQEKTAIELVKRVNEKEDIAVIGMGCKFSDKETYGDMWDVIANKRTTIERVSKRRIDLIRPNVHPFIINHDKKFNKGSYIKDIDKFDYDFFNVEKEAADYVQPSLRTVLEVVYHTLEDAGYLGEALKNNKTGVFVGNNFSKDTIFSYLKVCLENSHFNLSTDELLYNFTSGLATRIANFFDLHGPTYTIDASCPSSAMAIYNACRALKDNTCTTAIAGGLIMDLVPAKRYNNLVWIFIHEDNIITRLFDENPEGSYFGEGSAFLMLKPLSKALEDGDRIHGIISGESINNNGGNSTYTQSSMEDLKKAVVKAVKEAKVDVNDIGLAVGEGYPHKMEEGIELSGIINGINQFTDKRQFCALSGISNLGYLQSAIAAFSTILCMQALERKLIPPNYHFNTPNDAINLCRSPFYVNDTLRDWECEEGKSRYALGQFYGFGGSNVIMIYKEAPEYIITKKEKRQEILLITGKTENSFQKNLDNMIEFLLNSEESSLTDICYTASTRRILCEEYRLAVVADSKEELISNLRAFRTIGKTRQNVFYCDHTSDDKAKQRKIRMQSVEGKNYTAIAEEFCRGSSFEFSQLYEGTGAQFIEIPSYAFDRRACWCYPIKRQGKRENRKT